MHGGGSPYFEVQLSLSFYSDMDQNGPSFLIQQAIYSHHCVVIVVVVRKAKRNKNNSGIIHCIGVCVCITNLI